MVAPSPANSTLGLCGMMPACVAHLQQLDDGFAAILAVIERALVDVHADELVGHLRIEIAGKLHGVLQRFLAIVQSVLNAVAQSRAAGVHQLRAQLAANGVAAQRQRQTGLIAPPLAHVQNAVQSRAC